jgi:hypothetical protein
MCGDLLLDGMIVAAVDPAVCGTRMPMIPVPNPETMGGWRIGAFSSSPRLWRIDVA